MMTTKRLTKSDLQQQVDAINYERRKSDVFELALSRRNGYWALDSADGSITVAAGYTIREMDTFLAGISWGMR